MPKVLTNDFSWSKSRHERFSECLRAYYFQYYRSWGGWDEKAPRDVRELYVLKKLGNRFTWAGTVVHDCIKDALLDLRAGREVSAQATEERALRLMRGDFKHSAARAYWKVKHRKEFVGLAEHEYQEPLPPEAWKRNWENVRQALAWFFQSPWIAKARSLRPEQWLEVDAGADFSSFTLDGVKVFAIPDFAYVEDDGTPVVVDWKTGSAREGYDEQVLGYALYLATRYRFPVEQVRAVLVYLNAGLEQQVQVDAAAVESFRAHFTRSVTRMRELLADPAKNVPRPEDAFPQTDDLEACARCVFRRPCGRASAAAAAGGGEQQVA